MRNYTELSRRRFDNDAHGDKVTLRESSEKLSWRVGHLRIYIYNNAPRASKYLACKYLVRLLRND